MIDSECLKIFEKILAQKVREQLDSLSEDIESAKRRAASKDLSQSSATIDEVKELFVKVLESRVDFIFEILSGIPFTYSHTLGDRISEISLKYFPPDLGDIQTCLDDIIHLTHNEHVKYIIIKNIAIAKNNVIERFMKLLEQYLLTLKRKHKSPLRRICERNILSKVIASAICGIILISCSYLYLSWKHSGPLLSNNFRENIFDKWPETYNKEAKLNVNGKMFEGDIYQPDFYHADPMQSDNLYKFIWSHFNKSPHPFIYLGETQNRSFFSDYNKPDGFYQKYVNVNNREGNLATGGEYLINLPAKLRDYKLEKSWRFQNPIVPEILPLTKFYQAEYHHQDYYKTHALKGEYYRKISGRDQVPLKVGGEGQSGAAPPGEPQYTKPSDEELHKKLSPLQYKVTQEEGTEPPFHNEYWDNQKVGIYVDVVSGEPLFSSTDKYDSGIGWPSFTKPLEPGNIVEKEDRRLLTVRTEVRSKHGDSHLGHVFKDGPPSTGLRYSMNSAALRFIPKEDLEREGYGKYLKLFGPTDAVKK